MNAGYVLRPTGTDGAYSQIETFHSLPENSIEVVGYGSSSMLRGFNPMENLTKSIEATKFGKQKYTKYLAEVLPGVFSTILVFLLAGIWHGAEFKYIVFGLWNGMIISVGLLFKPITNRIIELFKINIKSKTANIVCQLLIVHMHDIFFF